MLAAMFTGALGSAVDAHGRWFIDRDGARFRVVLNFLRSGSVCVGAGDDAVGLEEVLEEAEFFGVECLAALCRAEIEKGRMEREIEALGGEDGERGKGVESGSPVGVMAREARAAFDRGFTLDAEF